MIDTSRDQPAFPRSYTADGHNGMTLRDWLAGKALAGLCANPGGPFQACSQSGWTMINCGPTDVARQCYQMADAMMAEREYSADPTAAVAPHNLPGHDETMAGLNSLSIRDPKLTGEAR